MTRIFSYTLATILLIGAYFVSAAPANNCDKYRITSPVVPFSATDGQCYLVSYDLSQVKGSHTISVDLYDSSTKKKVSTLIDNESTDGRISTSWFNMDVGKSHKSGKYYYHITFDNGKNCPSVKSPVIDVTYNKNSPPATCPTN
jgi:hypothetical protein